MKKKRLADVVTVSALMVVVGLCGSVILGSNPGGLRGLHGAAAQCKCTKCTDQIVRKDECFYNSSLPNPACSTTECTVRHDYWGECPVQAGGADCPLRQEWGQCWRIIEYRHGAPAACATASNALVKGPASGECGPHNEITWRCVLSPGACQGTVTGTLYNYPKSLCNL